MARMTSPKTTRIVVSKGKQEKGKVAQTGEMSDHRIQASPDKSKDRGIGSSFAYAVGEVMKQAAAMKTDESGTLGRQIEAYSIEEMTRLVEGK